MSKRPSAETTERLKPGKPHDSGQSSSHVRSSVSFLNPDTVPGSTHLERAPSLNRLHAQSSTETSGLGETVTSGFSSQESVLSYLGDERDRSGFGDRSRRRAGGSPGSGRAVLEHESVSRQRDPNLPSGLSFQQSPQDQYLTVPQPAKRVDRQDIQTHRDDVQRSKYEPYSGDNQPATGRRQRSARDTGGRSLTPQEAKDEYDQRQRRIKQTQRKRDSDSNSVPQETRRSGTSVSASERQRSSSGHRSKEGEHTDSSVAKEHQGVPDGRRRVTPSNNNSRDSGKDSTIEDHRQSSRGDRLDGANTATGKSKQRSKEAPATRSIPRSSAKSSSRDSLELSSNSVPTSGSARSDVASKNRDRSSSDFNISDHERRSSSKSREEIKTHSSSSSKSFDSQVSVIKPHNSKINSLADSSVGKSKSLEIDKPALIESGQPVPVKRKQRPTPSEIARSLPRLPDPDNSGSGKLEQSQRSLDESRDPSGPQRNVHSSSKGSKSADQIEGRAPYPRQRSEPLETSNSSAKQRRDHEGGGSATSKDVRHLRQEDDRYRRDQADGADASERRYGRAGARETATRVRSSDVQDSDTGRVVRRADHNPRDTRDRGAGDRPGEGNRPKHSRERKADPSEGVDVPREKRSSSSSRARQTQPDRYDLEQGDHSQSRRQHHRVPADARIHHQRDGGNTRSDREEDDDEIMNYERLFQEAHGRVNGTGGAGSRTHPTDGGHPAPSARRVEGSLYGETHSNAPRSNQTSDVPSSDVAGHGASPHGRGATVSPPTSVSASHVSQPPSGSAVTVKVTSPAETGLKLENVEREWERRDSRSSNKSHTSKISGLFLGVSTGSAWAKWSRERRASYQRRIEKMEQADTKVPAESAKISTPIKKARQEGLKFVSPDLEATYLTEDDINELRRHKQQQVHAMRVIEKSRRHKFRAKHEVKMTPEEWHLLEEFWNHSIFVRARFIGILVSLLAFIFMIISITNQSWIRHNSWNLTTVEGLWVNCTKSSVIPNSEQSCHASGGRSFEGGLWKSCYYNHSDTEALPVCPDRKPSWQNGVIGLMIFATGLGFLASVLSICGVFTNPLPKKMYYFHSAGEVFFICALSASVALIVFPIAVELDSSIQTHHYSVGYGLGWVGTFLFLAAAVCLSLDDLVRESSKSKVCRWCWRGKHSDRNDLRQV